MARHWGGREREKKRKKTREGGECGKISPHKQKKTNIK